MIDIPVDVDSLKAEEVVSILRSMFPEARPFERLTQLKRLEATYGDEAEEYLAGYSALANAAVCFMLETCQETSQEEPPTEDKMPKDGLAYRLLVARNINSFHALRSSQISALAGYPFSGFAALRNAFDNLVNTCAVLNGMTTFHELEGIGKDGSVASGKALTKKRRDAEFSARKSMLEANSGLEQATVDQLKKLDVMFDWETHGARLSMAQTVDWIREGSPLLVGPKFVPDLFALFMNRHSEAGWMLHRLMAVTQLRGYSAQWKKKWVFLDKAFKRAVESLTTQLNKPIGAAFSKFVTTKFPFDENSTFPL